MENKDNESLSPKEQMILDAACNIFAEKGFSAATTNEIAKAAGVAEGTIFRYFKTKKDILRGLFGQMASVMADKIVLPSLEKILLDKNPRDPREIIREIIIDRIKLVDKHFAMFKVVMSEVLFHEDMRNIFIDKVIIKFLPVFEKFYNQKVEEGQFRPIKPRIVLRTFVGNIMVLIAQKNVFGEKLPIDDIDEEIEAVIDILLFGISNKSSE